MDKRSLTSQALVLVAKYGGGSRSVQDLRRARDVIRVGMLFSVTILVPAVLLSYLALSTIRSEELLIDYEYRSRASAMTEALTGEVDIIFDKFELATASRLDRGESPLNNLGDLSPYLRGAYRFNQDGDLAAPFELVDAPVVPPATATYRTIWSDALAMERNGEHRQAAVRYGEAARAARHPVQEAEARLAEARAWVATDNARVADDLLEQLFSEHANRRESRGFRVGDLALLMRAEIRFAAGPGNGGQGALEELVEQLLGVHRWTVGQPGEAAVVERALQHLAGVSDPDWLARQRAELNHRAAQLEWTGLVAHELELIGGVKLPPGTFQDLTSTLDSPSVWIVMGIENGLYAFSFSSEALQAELQNTLKGINDREDRLVGQLLHDRQPTPLHAVYAVPLAQPLDSLFIAVAPSEPQALANLKNRRRLTRFTIVLVSVFLVGVGVFLSARTIGHEMQNARAKADFAANVSHELRSPITQIRLKGEALQLGLTEPGQDTLDHYDAIVRESERLSRLVDNVLDFAAIERGAKRYQLRMEDLLSVVWQTVESNRDAVEAMGMTLELQAPDDLPPVWLDREAVGQVLVNLMSNAAKYGKDGGWVGVRVRPGLHGVMVEVSDKGLGISKEDAAHIFDHFYRSADKNVRRQKGTGIGLTIVRYIVEAHGGTIGVESAPGQGTTFTVTFPLEPPPGAGAAT